MSRSAEWRATAGFLLDTNVVSELRKPRPNAGAAAWWSEVDDRHLYLSALTVGELQRGIALLHRRGEHRRADRLETWLGTVVGEFGNRVLPVDAAVAMTWGRLSAAGTLPTVDGLIAATAEVHRLTVVTRNGKDFGHSGVPVLDPFR